jgi:hypothetical protein
MLEFPIIQTDIVRVCSVGEHQAYNISVKLPKYM